MTAIEPESPTTDLGALDAALARLRSDDSVLHMSEYEAEKRSGYQPPTGEGVGERMIMNMMPRKIWGVSDKDDERRLHE